MAATTAATMASLSAHTAGITSKATHASHAAGITSKTAHTAAMASGTFSRTTHSCATMRSAGSLFSMTSTYAKVAMKHIQWIHMPGRVGIT